jgi:dTDP-4-dehydrorhamnose reductase
MRILVHGISSWIGFYVADYLAQTYPLIELIGTTRTIHNKIDSKNANIFEVKSTTDLLALVRETKPDLFLHLARGERNDDFLAHQALVDLLNELKSHYGYASSFNACDGNLVSDHHEGEKGNAHSEYGKFKARCEAELISTSASYAIFRFSQIHGWAPNRVGRTEAFLQKLQQGEMVRVNPGIVQNRAYVGDLAGMITDVIVRRGQGVFHLGPGDASDEMDFLGRIAEAFGYSRDQITVDAPTPTNAFMVPRKILEMFGNKWRRTETDTLKSVVNSPSLKRYRRH